VPFWPDGSRKSLIMRFDVRGGPGSSPDREIQRRAKKKFAEDATAVNDENSRVQTSFILGKYVGR
jgi:hypothetical protein